MRAAQHIGQKGGLVGEISCTKFCASREEWLTSFLKGWRDPSTLREVGGQDGHQGEQHQHHRPPTRLKSTLTSEAGGKGDQRDIDDVIASISTMCWLCPAPDASIARESGWQPNFSNMEQYHLMARDVSHLPGRAAQSQGRAAAKLTQGTGLVGGCWRS